MPKTVGDFGFTTLGMFKHQGTENTEQTGNDVQVLSGVNISIIEMIMFPLFAIICIVNLVKILKNIE